MSQQELITEQVQRRGISWYALAKATGIRESMLNNWRYRGFQFKSPEIVEPLADYLGIDRDTLYIAGNHIPDDVHKALIRHPELLPVIRNLVRKIEGQTS